MKNSFNSYPLDRLAITGAVAAIEDEDYFQEKRALVMRTRDLLARQLEAMGFLVCPSATNFLFVRHPDHDAASLASALRAHAILVRHFRQPEIENYLRIGTEAECASLHMALSTILEAA